MVPLRCRVQRLVVHTDLPFAVLLGSDHYRRHPLRILNWINKPGLSKFSPPSAELLVEFSPVVIAFEPPVFDWALDRFDVVPP